MPVGKNTKPFVIYLPIPLLETLRSHSKAKQMKMSAYIRDGLKEKMERDGVEGIDHVVTSGRPKK